MLGETVSARGVAWVMDDWGLGVPHWRQRGNEEQGDEDGELWELGEEWAPMSSPLSRCCQFVVAVSPLPSE